MLATADPPSGEPGLVVALEANYCRIELDRPGPSGARSLLCTRRTRLGKSGLQICVGDRVGVEAIDWPAARAAVASLAPRFNLLARPAVANVSRVVVVVALVDPRPDPLQLTRFLLTAEALGVAVELVFSKADLAPEADQRHWCERAAAWGYRAMAVSCQGLQGLQELRQRLSEPGISVLCGPSGVGKSSLLNALCPTLDLRVAAVSGRLRRGRHTTRHVALFPLTAAALVADSPGFNRPELPETVAALAGLFPELRQRLGDAGCRFADCRHLGDPGCSAGSDWDRQSLYARCLEELESRGGTAAPASRQRQGSLKQRGDRAEPRLNPRLRRDSRRRQRQQLQPLARSEGPELSPPDPEG